MIDFDEVVRRLRLERVELEAWVAQQWVLPEKKDEKFFFDEADLARLELIYELRYDLMVNEEAIPLVLGLMDQLYATRRMLRGINEILGDLPQPLRDQICKRLGPGPES